MNLKEWQEIKEIEERIKPIRISKVTAIDPLGLKNKIELNGHLIRKTRLKVKVGDLIGEICFQNQKYRNLLQIEEFKLEI